MEDALELARQVALLGPTEQALRAYEAVRCGPPGDRCVSCITNQGTHPAIHGIARTES